MYASHRRQWPLIGSTQNSDTPFVGATYPRKLPDPKLEPAVPGLLQHPPDCLGNRTLFRLAFILPFCRFSAYWFTV